MKLKIISILVVMLMVLGSFGVFGTNIENQKDVIDESIVETQTVISGYRVDDVDEIGTVGKYTRTLSENNALGVEILSKRTPTDRFFKNDDGTITAYLSIIPNCYQDQEGVWHDGERSGGISTLDAEDSWENNANYLGYVYWHKRENWADGEDDEYIACKVFKPSEEDQRYNLIVGQHHRHDSWTGYRWQEYFRAFAEWDVTSLQSTQITNVNSVDVTFYVSSDTRKNFHNDPFNGRTHADLKITSISNTRPSNYYTGTGSGNDKISRDPNSQTCEDLVDLMQECGNDGWTFFSGERVDVGDGVVTLSKNENPTQDNICDSFLRSIDDGWFGMAFRDENEDACDSVNDYGGVLIDGEGTPDGSDDYTDDARMVLKVTYEVDVGDVAIFIAGGIGTHQNYDSLDDAFYNIAKEGQEIFEKDLGYGDDRVKLIRKPTKDRIQSTLNGLASEMCNGNNVFIYLSDHGVGNPYVGDSWWADRFGADWLSHEGKFCLNPEGELLSWNQLSNILDEFYDETKALGGKGYGTATIVVESCFSGHFVTESGNLHKSKGGKNHIIISATGPNHYSWGYTGKTGYSVFSDFFFNALKDGKTTYGDAWEIADGKIVNWIVRNAKYIARELEKNNRIFDIFNNKFSNMPLIKIISSINGLLRNSLTVDVSEKILSPQFVPFDNSDKFDEQKLIRNEKEMSTQCPLLTDNGIGAGNYAGTTSKNVPDNLDNANSENDDGWLALHTYPCRS